MKALDKTIEYWSEIERYIRVAKSKSEYKEQFALLGKLMDIPGSKRDKHTNALMDLLVKNIQIYEARVLPANTATAVDVLLSIMEEHELTQSDLPEIGSQSLVSKILTGERKLTKEHIRKLSKRFHVSPAVFFD